MIARRPDAQKTTDFLARPRTALFWWGLPLVAGWSADALPISPIASRLVWAAALAWMGAGCALNAARCGRLHCYVAAPVLILGAVGVTACVLGFDPLGRPTASYVINASLALALLSFLAEAIWGKYRPQ